MYDYKLKKKKSKHIIANRVFKHFDFGGRIEYISTDFYVPHQAHNPTTILSRDIINICVY